MLYSVQNKVSTFSESSHSVFLTFYISTPWKLTKLWDFVALLFFLALGGQSETPASISVPATPQRHAALVRGRFQRHSEVPEERGLDKLTASWNLGESVKGVDFTVYAPIRVFALPCLKTLRVPETVTVRPTSRSGLCDDRRHTPTVDRSPSPALKSRHDVNTDGFNIPVVQSGAQEWIDTAARAAVTDVGRSPPGQNRHV